MKHIFTILSTILLTSQLHAAQTLRIKSLKSTEEIPFTAQTTILEIKQALAESLGIPPEQQILLKNEGTAFSFPLQKTEGKWGIRSPMQEITIALEDNKTCADYDLQATTPLQLYLKSREPDAREIKLTLERKESTRKALSGEVFTLPAGIVSIITNYVT